MKRSSQGLNLSTAINQMIAASFHKYHRKPLEAISKKAMQTSPQPEGLEKLTKALGKGETVAKVIVELFRAKKLPKHFKEALGGELFSDLISNLKHILEGDKIYTKRDYFLTLGSLLKKLGSCMAKNFLEFKDPEAKIKFKQCVRDFLDKEI